MKDFFRKQERSNQHESNRQVTEALRHTLEMKYGRVLGEAKYEWARLSARKDASDACVSVRVSEDMPAAFKRFESARKQYASLAA